MRKDTPIPEWIRSIPRHKMEQALAAVAEKAKIVEDDIEKQIVPNPDTVTRESFAFKRGLRTAFADVMGEFEKHTVMASVKKKKAKEVA